MLILCFDFYVSERQESQVHIHQIGEAMKANLTKLVEGCVDAHVKAPTTKHARMEFRALIAHAYELGVRDEKEEQKAIKDQEDRAKAQSQESSKSDESFNQKETCLFKEESSEEKTSSQSKAKSESQSKKESNSASSTPY